MGLSLSTQQHHYALCCLSIWPHLYSQRCLLKLEQPVRVHIACDVSTQALVTQQFDMVDKLLAAGADPLIQCQHAKRTTALHVLFEDFEQHKAEYSALLTEVLTAALVLERQDRQGVPVPVGDVLNGAVGDKGVVGGWTDALAAANTAASIGQASNSNPY